MAKPTDLGRWATVGGTQIVIPVEGKKDVGFGADEEPSAQAFNWKWNNDYDWHNWLDGITAAASTNELVMVDSSGVLSSAKTIPNLTVETLTITTEILHPSRTKNISALTGSSNTGTFEGSGAVMLYWEPAGANEEFVIPLNMHEGDHITGITGVFFTNSSLVTMTLYRVASSATATQVSVESTSSSGWQELAESTTLDVTVAADEFWFVQFSTVSASARIEGVTVTYDRP